MTLMTRVSRLFRADLHAVLDQVEEPDLILRQAIREMEEDLTQDRRRIRALHTQVQQMGARDAEIERSLDGIEDELDLCFQAGKDDLSRALIRRRLEGQSYRAQLSGKRERLESQMKRLAQRIQEHEAQLDAMRPSGLGGAYMLYLLGRSRARTGRVITLILWLAVTGLLWVMSLPLSLYLSAQLAMIWGTRSLCFHQSLLAAFADLGLCGLGLIGALGAYLHTGSLFLSLWCLFLIQAAKEKIWSIASTLASAQPAPEIRMGLVAYRDRGDAYVTKVLDLSSDLDSMYATLMDFRAEGGGDGPESVNQALHEAVNQLSWSRDDQTYRVLFLVGDAPPHMDYQDDVKWPTTLDAAQSRGIRVNAIQCGRDPGTTQEWRKIAGLGQGSYFQVEQTGNAVAIATPYGERLARLSAELDETRLYYGDAEDKAKQTRKLKATAKLHTSASVEAQARRAAFNASVGGESNFLGEKELAKTCASVHPRFVKIRCFRLQPGRQGRYWKESMRSKLASRVFYRTRYRAPERHPEPERKIRDAASEMVCFDKRPRDHRRRRRLALGQRRDRLGRGGGLARERGGPHRRSRSGSDFASRQRPAGAGPVTNPTNGATVGAGADPDPDRGKGRCPRAGGEPPAGPSSADTG